MNVCFCESVCLRERKRERESDGKEGVNEKEIFRVRKY